MSFTAETVMDLSAALLNNVSKSLFSYTVLLPYLKLAHDDMESELIDNGVVTNFAGSTNCIFTRDVLPASLANKLLTVPGNFFLPIKLWERASSSTDDEDFVEMTEVSSLPIRDTTPELGVWAFYDGYINFIGCTDAERTVRVEYIKTFAPITSSTSNESVDKAKSYLAFRTAALAAEFKGRNKVLADSLNLQASVSIDRLVSIYTKNRQGIRIRRKRFNLFDSIRRNTIGRTP